MKKKEFSEIDFEALEAAIAYGFADRALLERALTHRSWAHEQVAPGAEPDARRLHNEAFEFIGDSVLGMVVSVHLFRSYPDVTEGELSRMKHRLVSAPTLARAARRLRLGDFLRIGRGEEKSGGRLKRAILADAFEAVIAAVFLDGGMEPSEAFILRALAEELERASPEAAAAADYKTLLQETLQASRRAAPQYEVISTDGPPHHRTFHVEVSWEGGRVSAEGQTIKAAETAAARLALEQLKNEVTEEAAD